MNLQEIKEISIRSYMESIGCDLKREHRYYGLYSAPYRKDSTASLKVDFNQNLWIDFGDYEKKGSIIDLVIAVNNYSYAQAINYLKKGDIAKNSFSFHCNSLTVDHNIKINKLQRLCNKALIQYVVDRKINIQIACQYSLEAYYEVNKKRYFSIAFENDSKGYELRNKYFKNCVQKKDITELKNGCDILYVFEGFIDFLSFKTAPCIEENIEDSYLVLNSLALSNKSFTKLAKYKEVRLFLDNDDAGKKATDLFSKLDLKMTNYSAIYYQDYKDYNDWLCNKLMNL